MPNTDAGFPLTSIDRRSSWRAVAGPVVAVGVGAAPACARAIVGRAAAAAKADASTARRVGMFRSPNGIRRSRREVITYGYPAAKGFAARETIAD